MQNESTDISTTSLSLFTSGANSQIAAFLNHKDLAQLSTVSKLTQGFFQAELDIRKVLYWCLRGFVKPLVHLLAQKPQCLFEKGDIIDESTEQCFYHVSPFELLIFMGDWDLLKYVLAYIKGPYLELARLQTQHLQRGGADLIKLSFNPISCDFTQLLAFQDFDLSFPLLQNPDGIILWNNQLFYVNQMTQVLRPLQALADSQYKQLLDRINAIPDNSGARSSDAEHQCIAKLYDIQLHREGICFKKNNTLYHDVTAGHELLAYYRQYLHLTHHASDDECQQHWIFSVGGAQRQMPVHMMQRLCANDKFSPIRDEQSLRIQRFARRDMYWDLASEDKYKDVYPLNGLGRSFALSKGSANMACNQVCPSFENVIIDLYALHRLFKVSADFKLDCLSRISQQLQEKPLDDLCFFQPLMQNHRFNVVEIKMILPSIIMLKLSQFLLKHTELVVLDKSDLINHIWPLIRAQVSRYAEMEFGSPIQAHYLEEVMNSLDVAATDFKPKF